MCLVDRALAHERRDDRRVETLGERDQLRLTAGPEHAAAGPQDGSLGLLEQPRRLPHRVRWRGPRDRGEWLGIRIGDGDRVEPSVPAQHVDGDLQVHGAARRCERDRPRLSHELRNRLRALGPGGVLDDRGERGELTVELVQVAAMRSKQLAWDLARDRHDGYVGARRLHDRSERVQRPRPGREQQRRRTARAARITVSGETRAELGPGDDRFDLATGPQRLPHRERVDSGHAERDVRTKGRQRLHDDVAAGPLPARGSYGHRSSSVMASRSRPPAT